MPRPAPGPQGPWPDIRWPPLLPTHPEQAPTNQSHCNLRGIVCVCEVTKTPLFTVFRSLGRSIFLGRRQQKTVVFTWFLVPRRGPDGKKIRRFSEPTFRPSGATNHWKNTVFRDFPTFSRICIFFLLTLSLLSASASSAFHLSILSEV